MSEVVVQTKSYRVLLLANGTPGSIFNIECPYVGILLDLILIKQV